MARANEKLSNAINQHWTAFAFLNTFLTRREPKIFVQTGYIYLYIAVLFIQFSLAFIFRQAESLYAVSKTIQLMNFYNLIL